MDELWIETLAIEGGDKWYCPICGEEVEQNAHVHDATTKVGEKELVIRIDVHY